MLAREAAVVGDGERRDAGAAPTAVPAREIAEASAPAVPERAAPESRLVRRARSTAQPVESFTFRQGAIIGGGVTRFAGADRTAGACADMVIARLPAMSLRAAPRGRH